MRPGRHAAPDPALRERAVRVTWTYDNNYQLTRELRGGANAYDISYAYDAAGNRKTKDDGGVRTTYLYDAGNQLSTEQDNTGRTTYTFDNSGNQKSETLATGARTTFLWDVENRLTAVIPSAGTRNTFAYDGDSKRVQIQDSGGTTKLIWDDQNVLMETDGADDTLALYTLDPGPYGNVLSQNLLGTPSFFLFDGLGCTDRLTDDAGAVTDSYVYQAFGLLEASTGTTSTPFLFVGQQGYYYDPDLVGYYLRARHYDPSAGRFRSRDPLGAYGGDFNLYGYVGSSPVLFVDPSGLQRNPYQQDYDRCVRQANDWYREVLAQLRGLRELEADQLRAGYEGIFNERLRQCRILYTPVESGPAPMPAPRPAPRPAPEPAAPAAQRPREGLPVIVMGSAFARALAALREAAEMADLDIQPMRPLRIERGPAGVQPPLAAMAAGGFALGLSPLAATPIGWGAAALIGVGVVAGYLFFAHVLPNWIEDARAGREAEAFRLLERARIRAWHATETAAAEIAEVIRARPPFLRKTREECDAQFDADNQVCRTLRPAGARRRCFEQAMYRYAQCIAGRWEPPLFWPD